MTQTYPYPMPMSPGVGPEGMSSEEEELDLLFNAYFEGELTPEERADFDAKLEQDPQFAQSYEEFVTIMGGLRNLPFEFAPDDFMERVQSRMRTRSRGRFFADNYLYRSRIPYEVIAIVMIAIMGAAYMMMEPSTDKNLRDDLKVNKPQPTQQQTP